MASMAVNTKSGPLKRSSPVFSSCSGVHMPFRFKSRYLPVLLLGAFPLAQGQSRFNSGNATGLPVYPHAKVREGGGRGTVSLAAKGTARRLAAAKYVSEDSPEKVLQFYRARLKALGSPVECSGGKTPRLMCSLPTPPWTRPLSATRTILPPEERS